MLNFGASKSRVGGVRAPGPPLDPHLNIVIRTKIVVGIVSFLLMFHFF